MRFAVCEDCSRDELVVVQTVPPPASPPVLSGFPRYRVSFVGESDRFVYACYWICVGRLIGGLQPVTRTADAAPTPT